jgi:hypothetical protein
MNTEVGDPGDEPIPLTANDRHHVGAIACMLVIARGRVAHRHGNPAPYYRAAGEHLAALRRGKSQAIWGELVRAHCGLGLRRAYELVALAAGKPLAQLRAEAAARARRSRHARPPHAAKVPKQHDKSMT